MIDYPSHIEVGTVVHNHDTGDAYDVTSIQWRPGHGWECTTTDVEGYAGPTFYPHPDAIDNDPDIPGIFDLLMRA